MRTADLITLKRDGGETPPDDLREFVAAVAGGRVPDYQVAAWLMAAYIRGMTPSETTVLALATRDSGTVLEWDDEVHPVSDKHSTGGVGDKISLILAPLAASMGISVPMVSGRTLGHTGGTLDKLESIPGMDVEPPLDRFRELVASNGLAMSGQTPDLAPADRIMYSLRDATSTVTSIPLICASILGKKLAEGLDSIVFDVKAGSGAFMKTLAMAEELAGTLVRVARESGIEARALLTDMDFVLGRTAGNALEVAESLDVLDGGGPPDVRTLTVALASEMAAMSRGLPEAGPGIRAECEASLDDGKAMDRFVRMVEAQGGDLEAFGRLSPAPFTIEVRAGRSGLWTGASALGTGEAVRELGGGRYRKDDVISPMVGWEQVQQGPSRVTAGELLGLVHADSRASGEAAAARIAESFVWDSERNSLIYGVL